MQATQQQARTVQSACRQFQIRDRLTEHRQLYQRVTGTQTAVQRDDGAKPIGA